MNRLVAAVASAVLCTSTTLPAQAALVADKSQYAQHVLDCLGLLFDSEKHAAQCGGPFGLVPPSDLHENIPSPACELAELAGPFGFTSDAPIRLANVPCNHCGVGLTTLDFPQLLEMDAGDLIRVAVC